MKLLRLRNWKWYYEKGRKKPEGEPEVLVKDDFVVIVDQSTFFMATPMATAWFSEKHASRPGEGEGWYDVPVMIEFRRGSGVISVKVPASDVENSLGLTGLLKPPDWLACTIQKDDK